jgi:hypothetical protein
MRMKWNRSCLNLDMAERLSRRKGATDTGSQSRLQLGVMARRGIVRKSFDASGVAQNSALREPFSDTLRINIIHASILAALSQAVERSPAEETRLEITA